GGMWQEAARRFLLPLVGPGWEGCGRLPRTPGMKGKERNRFLLPLVGPGWEGCGRLPRTPGMKGKEMNSFIRHLCHRSREHPSKETKC
ncbi:hypothetical protein NDU88_009744, partial [Pleurodeles waltl]